MARKKVPIEKVSRPKPYRTTKRFGILNPYGDLWSPETFDTEGAALKHVADFWRGVVGHGDLRRFKVIPVRVTVSSLRQSVASR